MTLVILAASPLLMVGMAFVAFDFFILFHFFFFSIYWFAFFLFRIMARHMQKGASESSDDYAAANVIATEVLSGFRTVASFAREPYERNRYRDSLIEATAGGVKRAYFNGVGMGSTFFFLFGIYGSYF